MLFKFNQYRLWKVSAMRSGLRSLIEPRDINFLKKKLEQGEITPEECKEVMKRLILKLIEFLISS